MSAEKRDSAVGSWPTSTRISMALRSAEGFIGSLMASFIAHSRRRFRSPFTILSIRALFGSERSWTAGEHHHGFDDTSERPNGPLRWTAGERLGQNRTPLSRRLYWTLALHKPIWPL